METLLAGNHLTLGEFSVGLRPRAISFCFQGSRCLLWPSRGYRTLGEEKTRGDTVPTGRRGSRATVCGCSGCALHKGTSHGVRES